jgi:hypothetical protein
MTMSSFEAGILVGCAAVVSSAAPDLPEPIFQASTHATAATAQVPAGMFTDMGAKCGATTADRERMMTEMHTAGQRLDDLVAPMNAASGPDRAQETAAAATAVIARRLTVRNPS